MSTTTIPAPAPATASAPTTAVVASPIPEPPAPSASPPGVSPARPGELQDKVALLLADHPRRAFTVTEVAKELGHSGGAVGNALKTLAADGRITETSTSPRRYTARNPEPYRPAPSARPPLPPRAPAPKPPAPATSAHVGAPPAPPSTATALV